MGVIAPIFHRGELMGFAAATAHLIDSGAAAPGLMAPGYLRGDEEVVLLNATPVPRVAFRLPSVPPPQCKVFLRGGQESTLTTKLDTAFTGSTPPDVMELGNTIVAKYAAAGALQDISSKKGSFQNSGTWLQGMA